ncbi:MAG TPA: hypothetical protein VE377_04490 [Candidatus Dormibacteraeota bacterium]|nr:hypothetical protein [Candidatus Dormibacteraeota bacterium]
MRNGADGISCCLHPFGCCQQEAPLLAQGAREKWGTREERWSTAGFAGLGL